MVSDREQAIFEAAIKLGALYHQWVGTPISRNSAASVETAIERAVILQPCVEEITVRLEPPITHDEALAFMRENPGVKRMSV